MFPVFLSTYGVPRKGYDSKQAFCEVGLLIAWTGCKFCTTSVPDFRPNSCFIRIVGTYQLALNNNVQDKIADAFLIKLST